MGTTGGVRPGSGRRRKVRTAAERARVIPPPPPPEDLNEREATAWRAHAAQVEALEILTSSDLGIFRHWARMEALLEAALDGERTEIGRDGEARQPSLSNIATFSRVVLAYATTFKCTPLARGAVPATAAPEPSEEDDPDDLRPLKPLKLVAPGKPETH